MLSDGDIYAVNSKYDDMTYYEISCKVQGIPVSSGYGPGSFHETGTEVGSRLNSRSRVSLSRCRTFTLKFECYLYLLSFALRDWRYGSKSPQRNPA